MSENRETAPNASAARDWSDWAMRRIEADFARSADTHLERLDLPAWPDLALYFKDESTHPTGSLKHRLARSLFLYGLCNGWIGAGRPVIDASSGSTAISEAYFARLLGLDFYAVMPRSTSPEKIAQIEFYGGKCHFVSEAGEVYRESRKLAVALGGHYLDQFTYAERATDWRGNNNIAETMFRQMALEDRPEPDWVVCGAGTGGTSATLGRYIRYRRLRSRLCVVDPERSVFFEFYRSGKAPEKASEAGSGIEGIGRPRVEPSFIPDLVDRMLKIPDAVSLAAMQALSRRIGRRVGGSTGTNFAGILALMAENRAAGRASVIATLICDGGDRYGQSYYDPVWLKAQGLDLAPLASAIERFLDGGAYAPELAPANFTVAR